MKYVHNEFIMVESSFRNGFCLSCHCEAYRCILRQRYTYLELNLDGKSGLLSEMFQNKVISFEEKKSLDKISNVHERNREIIDLFFDKKTNNHFISFLNCLDSSYQSHVREKLESVSICLSDLLKPPSSVWNFQPKKEYEEVDRIVMVNKMAVIGLCSMNKMIYFITFMDPHLFVFMDRHPFLRLTCFEFDLPVVKGHFHVYDMVACPDNRSLIVSDKANDCLWIADVETKTTRPFKIKDAQPTRMSLSNYITLGLDRDNDDIYSDNINNRNDSNNSNCYNNYDNNNNNNNNRQAMNWSDSFKIAVNDFNNVANLTEKLLKAKLSYIDKFSDDTRHDLIRNKTHSKTLLVIVTSNKEFCIDFYTDLPKMEHLKRMPLMLSNDLTISNAIQRSDNGHLYICFGKMDFQNIKNSRWCLREYSLDGQMIRNCCSSYHVWMPRYMVVDEVDDCILAISRFSDEILKFNCKTYNETLQVSPLAAGKNPFSLPSRIHFLHGEADGRDKASTFLLVGQGEIDESSVPATILILRKVKK